MTERAAPPTSPLALAARGAEAAAWSPSEQSKGSGNFFLAHGVSFEYLERLYL